jgi:hypothetical protein
VFFISFLASTILEKQEKYKENILGSIVVDNK